MAKSILLITILLLGILLPVQALSSGWQQNTPGESSSLTPAEIATLINEAGTRTTLMSLRVYDYSYTQAVTEYEVDKGGQVKREKSKVYEVSPVRVGRGLYARVQVSEDGVPFSAEKIERERARVLKDINEAEKKAAQARAQQAKAGQANAKPHTPDKKFQSFSIGVQERKPGLYKANWYVNPTNFLLSHEFYAPRRALLEGREAILLNFRPRPNFVYDAINFPFQEKIENFAGVMAQVGGRIWIDAADKAIMRLEAVPLQELNAAGDAPNANAPIGFALMRLPTGVWMPRRSWYNSYGREGVFWNTGMSHAYQYSDFKLFSASDGGATLDTPKTQP